MNYRPLQVKADQGVSLEQGGRNLLCVFAIVAQTLSLTLHLNLVPSWSLGSDFEQGGSSPRSESLCSPFRGDRAHLLRISGSFSIGCIYTLILLLQIFLSQTNPQSNSNCQETRGLMRH